MDRRRFLLAAAAAPLLLREVPAPLTLAGAALILAGIAIAARAAPRALAEERGA